MAADTLKYVCRPTGVTRAMIGQNFNALREFHGNARFIGIRLFMDKYSSDIEQVRRCCIH